MGRWYRLKLEPDDNDTFMVTAPAFPEVTSFGESESDALRWGQDAIVEAIAGRIYYQQDVPLPKSAKPRGPAVEISVLHFLKLALYLALREQSISRAELARRLETHRETVDRLFRLDHNSQLSQIEAAFKAIDVPISVDVPLRAA